MRRLIFDRDAIFSDRVLTTVNALGLRPSMTAFRSPWQNGIVERWVGSVRRELLDHPVVFNERHLRRLLGEYVAYYHQTARTTRLKRRLPAFVFPLPRREPALLSWLAGGWAVCITGTTGLRRRMGG